MASAVVRAAGGLRIVDVVLRTDFAPPPIAPRELLKQYFEGSVAWLGKDRGSWTPRLQSPGLGEIARAYGDVVDAGAVRFRLGMLVLVAEATS